jgi:capsular exopolysaccharide synthesis family protein
VPINAPQAAQRGMIGLLLGVVIGLVLAFIAETLDTSIGAIQDLEELLETPVLGVIPEVDPRSEDSGRANGAERGEGATDHFTFLPTIFAPRSPIAEAIRGLRTSLLLRILDRDVKTLVVTSAGQAEGKTTLALNLALAMAQLGKKTLLVETDLRNPSIRHILGIRRDPGVTDVVLGSASLAESALNFADLMLGKPGMESLLDSPGTDNFFVLPSGRRAPNPSELMASHGFAALLAEARERYDCVILDSAPVLSVSDATVLASQVDGILCVVRVGRVPRAALRRAKSLMDGTKTPLIGVCLNGVRAEASPDFHELSYYKYYYGPQAPKRPKPKKKRPARPSRVTQVSVALLALGVGVWAGRTATSFIAASAAGAAAGTPAASGPAPTVEPSAPPPRAAAPPAPPPTQAVGCACAFSVELPVSAGAPGRVLVGRFSTADEALAFGEDLIRQGVTPAYRVVATEAS